MRSLALSFLIVFLSICGAVKADEYNVDKAYKKTGSVLSFGKLVRNIFNLSGYNKSYALIVGISDFKNFNLLQTKNDPIRMRDYLLNEAGFDYVHQLTGDRVTLKRLRTLMLDVFPSMMNKQDRFLFYWSGHGVTDSRNGKNFGHLPLFNSRKNQFGSMLGMDSLSLWDKRMPSKQTLYLLDACFSGYAGLTGQSNQQSKSVKQYGMPSRQVLTAGRKGEETIVLNDRLSSAFTTAVLEGLRGKADYFNDNIVTVNELNTFVRTRVSEFRNQYKWSKPITPSLGRFYDGGEGEFFFITDGTVKVKDDTEVPEGSSATPQSGESVSQPRTNETIHSHNGRKHAHPLPAIGLNHSHSGNKPKAVIKLLWGSNLMTGPVDYLGSIKYIADLNKTHGSGWRLPTLAELTTFRRSSDYKKISKSTPMLEVWATHNSAPASYDLSRDNQFYLKASTKGWYHVIPVKK